MRRIFVFLITFIFGMNIVNAACTSEEKAKINSIAGNVKTSYEIITETKDYPDGTSSTKEYFKISILNITDSIYVEVTNDFNNKTERFENKDSNNGTITFNWLENTNVTNFSIKVYSSNKTSCNGELIKTLRLTTPKYNNYSNRDICNGIPDFYLCQKYTTVSNVDDNVFIKKVESFMSGEITATGDPIKQEKKNGILEFIRKNKWYIIGTFLLIALISGGAIVVRYKRLGEKKK